MGTALYAKGKLTDQAAPRIPEVDALLPEAGALMFLDPTHPYNPWTGPVASAQVIPNLAIKQAQQLIPAGEASTLGGILTVPSQWSTGAGLAERSAKGGLHLLPSQVNGLGTTAGGTATVGTGAGSSPFNAYMRGPGGLQNLYVAIWGRVSRQGASYDSGSHMHSRSDASTQAYGFYNRPVAGETQYPTGTTRKAHSGEAIAPTAPGTPFFQDIHVLPTLNSNVVWEPFRAGGGTVADHPNKNAGFILYGYYVENLTVSGRTYAQVNALARALYTAEVKTPGGRYHGDTWNSIA